MPYPPSPIPTPSSAHQPVRPKSRAQYLREAMYQQEGEIEKRRAEKARRARQAKRYRVR